jgi:two-component system, NarL family, invasion response regulator UvrY
MTKARSGGHVTVLLVDDHAVVRAGYRRFLESDPHVMVVGEAANSLEALNLDRELRPDVIVLDVALPGVSGIETLRRILAGRPEARVLMFSMYADAIYAARALKSGALGYVSKASAPELLVEGVRAVAGGRQYISSDVSQSMSTTATRTSEIARSLSSREHEVLRLLAQGYDVGEVGEHLGVSAKTVANLQSSIKQKLGASSAFQLITIARQLGLEYPEQEKL